VDSRVIACESACCVRDTSLDFTLSFVLASCSKTHSVAWRVGFVVLGVTLSASCFVLSGSTASLLLTLLLTGSGLGIDGLNQPLLYANATTHSTTATAIVIEFLLADISSLMDMFDSYRFGF
jgi:hypothetical protein